MATGSITLGGADPLETQMKIANYATRRLQIGETSDVPEFSTFPYFDTLKPSNLIGQYCHHSAIIEFQNYPRNMVSMDIMG